MVFRTVDAAFSF